MHSFYKAQVLTLIYSWAFALIFIVLRGGLYTPFFVAFYLIYSWIPAFVAFQFYHSEKIRLPFKLKWKSGYVWPIAMGVALFLFNTVLVLPFSALRSLDTLQGYLFSLFGNLTPFTLIFITAVGIAFLSILAGTTLYLGAYLGPELMWRGYAWDKIKPLGFWRVSLLTGLFMGLWKSPLIFMGLNYPLHPHLGVLWQIMFAISITPLCLYYRLKTQSVLGAVFFVGVYYAFSDFMPILFNYSESLWTGPKGLIDIIALNVFNALLFLKIRKYPLLEYEV